VNSVDVINNYIVIGKEAVAKSEINWLIQLANKVPPLPFPNQAGVTLLALLLLAVGATIYRIFCPPEIQASSETRWVSELNQPLLTYRSLAYTSFKAMDCWNLLPRRWSVASISVRQANL
jgi:hypothetical protein